MGNSCPLPNALIAFHSCVSSSSSQDGMRSSTIVMLSVGS